MKRKWCLALLLVIALPAGADSWNFGGKIAVSGNVEAGVFQHLDSPGRKNIAIAGDTVAVVWEDNRSGATQTYIAFKGQDAGGFSDAQRLSTGKSAFTPAILALGQDRFLAAWEQDDAVWMRVASPAGLGPAVRASRRGAEEVSLATSDGRNVIAAWSQRASRFHRIVTVMVKVGTKDKKIHFAGLKPVEIKPPVNDQSYPSVVLTKQASTVVWEDRRRGHTILLYSHAALNGKYSAPRPLNEVVQKSEQYGRGNGVTRVALAVFGDGQVAATWMDKRGYQTGYDIYAAFSRDGGAHFGANELVQDAFGEQYAQWHPAVAGDDSGRVVVAWDDDRDGSSNIWLAWKTDEGWSPNVTPRPASGDEQQTNPSLALDAQGNLHMVWLEQGTENGPSRVMYARARYSR
jgi:hypothetical protein